MRRHLFLLFLCFTHSIFGQNVTLSTAIEELQNTNLSLSKIVQIEKLLSKSPNDSLKAEGLHSLGKVFSRLEKYDKAYSCYSKALVIANQTQSTKQIAIVKEALGNLHFKLGNFDKSSKYYLESMAIFEELNATNKVAKIKGNLAVIDIKLGNTDQALLSLTKLSNDKNLDSLSTSIALLSIGNIYLESLSNPKKAIEYYKKSILLLNPKLDASLICSINQNIAESYFALKEFGQALYYNETSEHFLETQSNNELKSMLYLLYTKIYEAQNRSDLALINYKQYHHYQNLVDESKNSFKIENIEVSNQLKNYETNNRLTAQKIQILKAEKSLAATKIYVLILLLVMICLIIYILLKRYKNRISNLNHRVIQSQKKLEYTENKTDKIILDINQNNDFINQFTDRLKSVIENVGDDKSKNDLKSLVNDLHHINNSKVASEQINNDVPSTFLYQLETIYPELTEEERKICALIFLNYKNKEIAISLNLSLRSIENCRYRIRKKMKLETATSLYQQLQSL